MEFGDNHDIRIALARIQFPEKAKQPIEYWFTQEDDYTKDWVFIEKINKWSSRCTRLPDYLNDLNAVREIEEIIVQQDLFEKYKKELSKTTNKKFIILTTAEQRCKAILKTYA